MDAKDEELRDTIKTLWPIQGNAMAFILIPPREGSDKLTAAAITAMLLMMMMMLLLMLVIIKQLNFDRFDHYLYSLLNFK